MDRVEQTCVVVALAVCAALVCVRPSDAARPQVLTGKELVQTVLRGPFSAQGVVVTGDVDLRGRHVDNALSCRSCRFEGDFLADRATFEKPIDLARSQFDGQMDLSLAKVGAGLGVSASTFHQIVDWRGIAVTGALRATEARFDAPVLLSTGPPKLNQPVSLGGDVDFSLAVFSDVATFQGANFAKRVDFTLARFENAAVFANGSASGVATFARAAFGGVADLSNFTFSGPVEFAGTSFQGPAEFNEASFVGRSSFEQARFARGATFLSVTFPVPPQAQPLDSFRDVRCDGDLNFDYSELDRGIDFEKIVVTGAFSFNQAQLNVDSKLHIADVSAGAFEMGVQSAVQAVKHTSATDDLPGVLAMIESSAKARGDLDTANDAHYEHRLLDSRHESAPVRVLDVVFYRWAAGYFVRPFNPLVVLLALAAVATLIRTFRGKPATATTPAPKHRPGPLRRAGSALRRLFTTFLATLGLIAPAWGSDDKKREGREIEIFAYRILFACMLIGFANSNPTLRQMFDALR